MKYDQATRQPLAAVRPVQTDEASCKTGSPAMFMFAFYMGVFIAVAGAPFGLLFLTLGALLTIASGCLLIWGPDSRGIVFGLRRVARSIPWSPPPGTSWRQIAMRVRNARSPCAQSRARARPSRLNGRVSRRRQWLFPRGREKTMSISAEAFEVHSGHSQSATRLVVMAVRLVPIGGML
jgi:hypothetical protein